MLRYFDFVQKKVVSKAEEDRVDEENRGGKKCSRGEGQNLGLSRLIFKLFKSDKRLILRHKLMIQGRSKAWAWA